MIHEHIPQNILPCLNIGCLVLNFVGALMMYWFTPKGYSTAVIGVGNNMKKDIRNHKLVRWGMLMLTFGFLVQLILLL